MKNLMLLLLCCLATGCSSLVLRPDAKGPDFHLPSAQASESERMAFYQSHRIEGFGRGWTDVDGTLYDAREIQAYYDHADAVAEAGIQEKARASHRDAFCVPAAILASGAVAGAALGLAYGSAHGDSDVSGYGDGYDGAYGFMFGVLASILPSALDMLYYQRQSNKLKRQAADSFNTGLLRRLDLKIVPQPGGAKAGVDMRF